MLVGGEGVAGLKVHEAKPVVRQRLLEAGLCVRYWEPENTVRGERERRERTSGGVERGTRRTYTHTWGCDLRGDGRPLRRVCGSALFLLAAVCSGRP